MSAQIGADYKVQICILIDIMGGQYDVAVGMIETSQVVTPLRVTAQAISYEYLSLVRGMGAAEDRLHVPIVIDVV